MNNKIKMNSDRFEIVILIKLDIQIGIKRFYQSQRIKNINVDIINEVMQNHPMESKSRHHKQAVTIINRYAALFIPFT